MGAELPGIRYLVGRQLLGVNVPLTVLEDIQDYGLVASPQNRLSLFADVVDFIQ